MGNHTAGKRCSQRLNPSSQPPAPAPPTRQPDLFTFTWRPGSWSRAWSKELGCPYSSPGSSTLCGHLRVLPTPPLMRVLYLGHRNGAGTVVSLAKMAFGPGPTLSPVWRLGISPSHEERQPSKKGHRTQGANVTDPFSSTMAGTVSPVAGTGGHHHPSSSLL